jgi:iron complex outermembrane recepter protein
VRWARFDSTSRDTNTGLATGGYDEAAVSPTAAVMFRPLDGVHTYVLYTQGLQPGGVAPSTTTNANEEQPPIESRQYELGVKLETAERRLAGELALFRIEQDLEYTNASNTYVQNGSQEHQGIELSVRGRAIDVIELGLAGLWLDAEQVDTGDASVDGKRPFGVAEYQTNAWIAWNVAQVPGLTLSLTAYAVGDRYADSSEQFEMDGYLILNAAARYQFRAADMAWTTRLGIENLTDEEYLSSGTWYAAYGGSAYYGSPLGARLSLQADF